MNFLTVEVFEALLRFGKLLLWVSGIVCFFWILARGLKNEIVIFYDKTDFWLTGLNMILFFAISFVIGLSPYSDKTDHIFWMYLMLPIALIGSLLITFKTFKTCMACHPSNYVRGLVVYFFRHIYLYLGIIWVLDLLSKKSSRYNSVDRLLQLGLAGILTYGLYRLINGRRVQNKV